MFTFLSDIAEGIGVFVTSVSLFLTSSFLPGSTQDIPLEEVQVEAVQTEEVEQSVGGEVDIDVEERRVADAEESQVVSPVEVTKKEDVSATQAPRLEKIDPELIEAFREDDWVLVIISLQNPYDVDIDDPEYSEEEELTAIKDVQDRVISSLKSIDVEDIGGFTYIAFLHGTLNWEGVVALSLHPEVTYIRKDISLQLL